QGEECAGGPRGHPPHRPWPPSEGYQALSRLIGIEIALGILRTAAKVGGADGLVGLLRILRLGLIAAWRGRYVARAVIGLDHTAYGADCLIDNLHAVGPHIGDQADRLAADIDAFVESLRDPHGVRWGETELAACLLLER